MLQDAGSNQAARIAFIRQWHITVTQSCVPPPLADTNSTLDLNAGHLFQRTYERLGTIALMPLLLNRQVELMHQ